MKIKNLSSHFILIFWLIAFGVISASAQDGEGNLNQLPPLKISENGHYIVKPDGTPFFWLSDTQWVLNKLSDEQIKSLLDDRKQRGFTAVQVFAIRSWNSKVGFYGSWAQTDALGNSPFIDGDPLKLNQPYWNRWSWIMDEAKKRDMYFLMLIGDPLRAGSVVTVKSLQEAYEYGWLIGNFYRQKTNLLISVSQDNPPSKSTLGVPGFAAVAEGYTDGLNNIKNFDGKAEWGLSLITYHTWANSSEWFHEAPWLDINGVQGSRNEGDHINDKLVYHRINNDYVRTNPVKPVLLLEGSYEGEANMDGKLSPTTPRNLRMQFLYAVFGGSPGFSYGHCRNWQQFESIEYLNSEGVKQVSLLAALLRKSEWWTLQPDQSVITNGIGMGEQLKAALKSKKEIMVFYPDSSSAIVRNTLEKKVNATWFDPRNGRTIKAQSFKPGQSLEMTPPPVWEDAILVMK